MAIVSTHRFQASMLVLGMFYLKMSYSLCSNVLLANVICFGKDIMLCKS